MLSPKRTKFRKTQKGNDARPRQGRRPTSPSATSACRRWSAGRSPSRQIEAARMAITRHVKRGGKLWIRIFPDKPSPRSRSRSAWVTARAAPRSGSPSSSPGRVMYEIEGVDEKLAREAFRLAHHKLPVQTRFARRGRIC